MLPSRRNVLKITSALLGVHVLGPNQTQAQSSTPSRPKSRGQSDREFVLAAGMTEQEADCWNDINQFAGAMLRLPTMNDDHEAVHGIHVLQEKMLMRPGYRAYLEAAGGSGRKVPQGKELTHFSQEIDLDAAEEAELTDDESRCWSLMAKVAAAYAALPKIHPVEDHEVAHGLDLLRNRLLMRPTLRRYREAKGE